MALLIVTGPAAEPVTLSEAKSHVRVDSTADDMLITSLIVAAREYVEQVLRRALITQTWDYILDAFPAGDELAIPLPPLQSITSITYKDDAAVTYTFATANYAVSTAAEPGRVKLLTGYTWPSATLYALDAVRVRFKAGYGDAGSSVPQAIRQAILLLVGHWYENRESTTVGAVSREVPLAVEALLWPYRVLRFL